MKIIFWNFLFSVVLFLVPGCQLAQIPIGAVFENDTFFNESIKMLQYAVDEANDKILQDSGMRLAIETETIAYGREYAVSKSVCNLLELGVGVIFGPRSVSSAFHAMNICDAKEIPYINTYMDEDAALKTTVLNMHPHLDTLTQLVLDFVNASDWNKATILYESPLWLRRVANILEINNPTTNRINVRNLDYTTNNEFRPTLQDVRDVDETNIILECSTESLPIILRQAMQVGLMTKHFRWILTNLDTHSIDLEPYQYNGANITTFRILDTKYQILNAIKKIEEVDNEDVFNVDPESKWIAENELADSKCNPISNSNDKIPVYPEKFNDVVSLRVSLIYDAVMVFAMAILQLGRETVSPISVMCNDASSAWNKGYTILNFMKNIKYDGLSGKIEFDNAGVRSNITLDILELGENGLENVGTWSYLENPSNRLKIKRQAIIPSKMQFDDNTLRNRTLRIATALTKPYTMLKEEAESLTGNDRFEGYCVDLIFELSLLLEFSYEFVLEDDGETGECIDENRNEWNGMIGKVMSGEVDIAITDLTVTSERIKALDFTPSIMNLGIAILFQVPRKQAPSTFSFMAPFGNEVWILLGVTYLFVSICFFCLGRISPSQWENPFPCVEEPPYLLNQFTIQNSFWFAAGALLQQGSEIEVKAASVRLASAVWWFFTLIIVSSYTANLAAFLVAETRVKIIESVEDFRECGLPDQPKCKASFGAKRHGSTLKFFADSKYPTFVNMYKVMMQNADEVLVHENDDGLRKAMDENYAYLMESTSLLYFTERFCNVTMVGDLIDDRNYAIGMRKGYKYYNILSEGVLKLQERGVLDKLHTKWWKAKRGGGACQKKESSDAESLNLDHLEGVFDILFNGSISALLCGIISTVWSIHNRAREAKISFRQEMKTETKFLLKSLADPNRPKPVRFWKKQGPSFQMNNINSSN